MKQPHEVRHLNGTKINWARPPGHSAMCSWTKRTTAGHAIKGSFRTLCHLNRLNNLALHRFDTELQVIQPDWNVGVEASKWTHDEDSVWDLWIPGVPAWTLQRFFRANGLPGWYRHPPLFGIHYHGFTLPHRHGGDVSHDFAWSGFKVGAYVDGGWSTHGRRIASSQIEDYYNHALGLANQHTPGADKSWFPSNIPATAFDLKQYVARRAA